MSSRLRFCSDAAVFAQVLSEEPDWYTLGVYLRVPIHELDVIRRDYREDSIRLRLIEVFKSLERKDKCQPSWRCIADCLKAMGNYSLASKIEGLYVGGRRSVIYDETTDIIKEQFEALDDWLMELIFMLSDALKKCDVDPRKVKLFIERAYADKLDGELSTSSVTLDAIIVWLNRQCSILNYKIIFNLVNNLFKDEKSERSTLNKCLRNFHDAVHRFKSSVKMRRVAELMKEKESVVDDGELIELKLKDPFFSQLKMNQFEAVVREILGSICQLTSQMRVTDGCICVTWVVPSDIDVIQLLPKMSLETLKLIGVISLRIGGKFIYEVQEKGCGTLEAAMLQAIELGNTHAMEILLSMGCNPEIATFNGHKAAVTNIVNIKVDTSNEMSTTKHVYVLGLNKNVEAILAEGRFMSETFKSKRCSCLTATSLAVALFVVIFAIFLAMIHAGHMNSVFLFQRTTVSITVQQSLSPDTLLVNRPSRIYHSVGTKLSKSVHEPLISSTTTHTNDDIDVRPMIKLSAAALVTFIFFMIISVLIMISIQMWRRRLIVLESVNYRYADDLRSESSMSDDSPSNTSKT